MEVDLMSCVEDSISCFFICRFCDEILNDSEELKGHERTHVESVEVNGGSESEVCGNIMGPENEEVQETLEMEDRNLLDDLGSPPNKKRRRGSNSSAVTIECDEDDCLIIDTSLEGCENTETRDPSETFQLQIISTIDEIRNMIEKILCNESRGNDMVECTSNSDAEICDTTNTDVPSSPEIIEVAEVGIYCSTNGQSIPEIIENAEARLCGTTNTDVPSSREIIENAEARICGTTNTDVPSSREIIENDEARICCTINGPSIPEIIANPEARVSFTTDRPSSPEVIEISDDEPEPEVLSKDQTRTEVEQETDQVGVGEDEISGINVQTIQQDISKANSTPLLYNLLDPSRRQSTDVEALRITCSGCLTNFTSQKTLKDHIVNCLFKTINFQNVYTRVPIDLQLDDAAYSSKADYAPFDQVNLQEALPLETSITAVAVECIESNDPDLISSVQPEIDEPSLNETELSEIPLNQVGASFSDEAALNTGDGDPSNNADIAAETFPNPETDAPLTISLVSFEKIPSKQEFNLQEEPLDAGILISNVTGNYSLPAVVPAEVVPTNDQAFQSPVEPLDTVSTSVAVTFKCRICEKSFCTTKEYEKHLGTHGEKYVCTICGKVCKSKGGLKNHGTRMHWLEELLQTPTSPTALRPPSNTSSTSTDIILDEDANLETCSTSEDLRCELCPKTFSTRSLYLVHLKIFHRLTVTLPSENSSKSSDSYMSNINDNSTEEISHEQGSYKCDHCSTTFLLKPLLNYHMETTHGYEVSD